MREENVHGDNESIQLPHYVNNPLEVLISHWLATKEAWDKRIASRSLEGKVLAPKAKEKYDPCQLSFFCSFFGADIEDRKGSLYHISMNRKHVWFPNLLMETASGLVAKPEKNHWIQKMEKFPFRCCLIWKTYHLVVTNIYIYDYIYTYLFKLLSPPCALHIYIYNFILLYLYIYIMFYGTTSPYLQPLRMLLSLTQIEFWSWTCKRRPLLLPQKSQQNTLATGTWWWQLPCPSKLRTFVFGLAAAPNINLWYASHLEKSAKQVFWPFWAIIKWCWPIGRKMYIWFGIQTTLFCVLI